MRTQISGKEKYLAGIAIAALIVLVALLLLTGHVGLGHAVGAHGQQLGSLCLLAPGPCAPAI
jgi:hypothetical protein